MVKAARCSFFEQLCLAAFVGLAVSGFALSQRAPAAWLFLLPCLISIFWRIERVGPRLGSWTRYVAWAVLCGTAVLSLIYKSYPIISESAAARPTLIAGYSLAFFSSLFVLGTPAWRPASALFPTAMGTLLVAAFNLAAPLGGMMALAGAAAFTYLVLSGRTLESQAQRSPAARGRAVPLAISALGILLIAWGIIRVLPWLQVKVTEAANRLYGTGATHYSSLSLVSRLGDLEELKLSAKVVMRVWSSRPQKLRGRIFTSFDGQAWRARQTIAENLVPAPPGFSPGPALSDWLDDVPGTLYTTPRFDAHQPAGATTVLTKIVQKNFNEGMLVSPGNKLLVRLPASSLRMDVFEDLVPPMTASVDIYGVMNRQEGEVVQAGAASPEMLQEFLSVPQETDSRLKDLAARLATGNPAPEERVRRTVEFVQSQCHYSLTVGKFKSHQPVAEFLFEKKQGYCEYFASATAVLLRLEGVPCRYVTGFNVQQGNRGGGHFVVREADAHAWIEAYLPGRGWVETDPTPEAEYDALHANLKGGWFDDAVEWVEAELAEFSGRFGQGDWRAGLRWVWGQGKALVSFLFVNEITLTLPALALFSILAVWVRRRKGSGRRALAGEAERRRMQTLSPELGELLKRLDYLWARRGFARPVSRAPLEHLAGIPPEKITPALRDASRKVVEYFYRSCFGGASLSPQEAQDLLRSLDRSETL